MRGAGRGAEVRKVQGRDCVGLHGGAVGYVNRDGGVSRTNIEQGEVGGDEMAGSARVENRCWCGWKIIIGRGGDTAGRMVTFTIRTCS